MLKGHADVSALRHFPLQHFVAWPHMLMPYVCSHTCLMCAAKMAFSMQRMLPAGLVLQNYKNVANEQPKEGLITHIAPGKGGAEREKRVAQTLQRFVTGSTCSHVFARKSAKPIAPTAPRDLRIKGGMQI